jgi:hypothetical protein
VTARVLDHEACLKIIQSLPPVLSKPLTAAFVEETKTWFKADICKGAAVYNRGGFYADPDLAFRLPLHEFIGQFSFIAARAVGHYTQFFQGFFGATSKHPILYNYLV